MDYHEYDEAKRKSCKVCKKLFDKYKDENAQPVNDPEYAHINEPIMKRKRSRSRSKSKSKSKSKSRSKSRSKDAKKPRVRRRSISGEKRSKSKDSNKSKSKSRTSLSSRMSRSKSRSNLSDNGFDVNISDLHDPRVLKNLKVKKKYMESDSRSSSPVARPSSQLEFYGY